MKNAIAVVMLGLALMGCAAPNAAPMNQADQDYLYGTHAGQPQRPSLML